MPVNLCEGCERGLPVHIGIHVGELEMFMCTAGLNKLELEPKSRDAWIDERARKKTKAPFTFGGES